MELYIENIFLESIYKHLHLYNTSMQHLRFILHEACICKLLTCLMTERRSGIQMTYIVFTKFIFFLFYSLQHRTNTYIWDIESTVCWNVNFLQAILLLLFILFVFAGGISHSQEVINTPKIKSNTYKIYTFLFD